ncbi:MAG TPA: hypothetical protein VFI11_04405, partial [Anaerolineales bacterium]|nr:hypothetical protein [Anaerolineales bacterium]
TMQEIDPGLLRRSLVVVDSRQAVLTESGDLILPIQEGTFTPDDIHAELGEVLAGTAPGRSDPEQITLFKSVGLAVQDAVAAGEAIKGALAMGLGKTVQL